MPQNDAPRTLVVMRHAKAEADAPTDFERPLAASGRDDAAAVGSWLAERGVVADGALVSAALRTEQTWAAVAEGAGWHFEARLDEGLYAADPEVAVDLVRELGDDLRTVVLIGHNPTMGSLALLLDDGEGDPEASAGASGGFPTAAVAVFTYAGSWSDLAPGTASLQAFHVGRA